ncbi:exosortase-dependent surface protein XDP2 [Aliinostoc sp. HNIBRCY26]|uniref:exosortase-dependent surface protein XDP2 n=1 Tax=Aliinostoc sp. HNIBRCY26 TaxID=3418997 RepID=UPI003CFF4BB4
MKAKNIILSTGLVLSAVLGVSSSAKAASFTTNFSPNPVTDPKADITLNSIIRNDGVTVSDFKFVSSVEIVQNNNALGPASTDKGDTATSPGFDPNEAPSGAELAAYLGNRNLNNIVDTEDGGSFILKTFFGSAVVSDTASTDSFFFWERGLNSSIEIRALDASGNTIGSAFTIDKDKPFWTPAGYSIDTTEIGDDQRVGSYGVSFKDLNLTAGTLVSGLRLRAAGSFNGPDFKFVAADVIRRVDVPEPTAMIGLGSVAALAFFRRRQTKKSAV